MTSIVDLADDTNNSHLYRLKQLYGAPDFVKAANEEDLRPAQKLPHNYYGDPRFGHYPLHSKAACWASYGFFLENVKAGQYRPTDAECIEDRFQHAGRVYRISRDLGQLKQAVENNKPTPDDQLPDSDFAIVWHDGGVVERHMRLCNRHEVVKAAEFLLQNRDQLRYQDRQQAADRILQKAADFGLMLPDATRDFVTKQAGHGACSNESAVHLIKTRVLASRQNGGGELGETQSGLLKFATALSESPASIRNHSMRLKIAAVLDSFDREYGLVGEIRDGRLARLEDVLFSITGEKLAAAQEEFTRTPGGSIYKIADLEKVRLQDVRSVLGDDIAQAMTSDGVHLDSVKAAEVIPTLIRHDGEVFDRLMTTYGLQPAAKEAASYDVELDRDYLRSLVS